MVGCKIKEQQKVKRGRAKPNDLNRETVSFDSRTQNEVQGGIFLCGSAIRVNPQKEKKMLSVCPLGDYFLAA
jgi:hypothetical protein